MKSGSNRGFYRLSHLGTVTTISNVNAAAIAASEGQSRPDTQTVMIYHCFPTQSSSCSGPEGSRKLRFPDFMTMAQDGGKVVSLTHQPPLPPGNTPGTHFC